MQVDQLNLMLSFYKSSPSMEDESVEEEASAEISSQ
jgi:hypothetical protein